MASIELSKSKKNVNFDSNAQVVLIPSRTEYKIAGLNPLLWWSGHDYSFFHRSAVREIQMFAAFENLRFEDARKKLYHPSSNNEVFETAYCSRKQEPSHDCEMANMGNTVHDSAQSNNQKHIKLGRVDSLDCINQKLHPHQPHSTSNPSSITQPISTTNSSSPSFEYSLFHNPDWNLSFCVQMPFPMPFEFKERPSKLHRKLSKFSSFFSKNSNKNNKNNKNHPSSSPSSSCRLLLSIGSLCLVSYFLLASHPQIGSKFMEGLSSLSEGLSLTSSSSSPSIYSAQPLGGAMGLGGGGGGGWGWLDPLELLTHH